MQTSGGVQQPAYFPAKRLWHRCPVGSGLSVSGKHGAEISQLWHLGRGVAQPVRSEGLRGAAHPGRGSRAAWAVGGGMEMGLGQASFELLPA